MPRARNLTAVLGLATLAAVYACGGDDGTASEPITSTAPDAGRDTGLVFGDSSSGGDGAGPNGALPPARSTAAVGSGFACVLAKDGTVSCWGRNDLGQLGRDPAATPSCGAFPCSAVPTQVAGLTNVVRITAGDDFACALDSGRSVWCWGSNAKRQLEATPATVTTSFAPRKLIVDVLDVVAAGAHACVRDSDDIVRCWGDNTCSIFGEAVGAIQPVAAILVNVPKMTQLSLGRDAMCGVSEPDGKVLCWGADHHGSLGHDLAPSAVICNGVPSDPVPKSVQGASDQLPIGDVADVHVGDAVSCARHTGGQVSCWGDNSRGGLGQGLPDASAHPRAVDVPAIFAIELAVAGGTACAITANRLLCWGNGADGQLESLSTSPACGNQNCRALGYAISNMLPVHEVAVGPNAIGAIKDDLTVWMWGRNSSAELAIPLSAPSNTPCPGGACVPTPTQVSGLPPLD